MSDLVDFPEDKLLLPFDDIDNDEEEEETPDEIDFKLNNYGIDFDVAGLVRRLKNDSIYLPNFQRNYVWNLKKASKFIESLLLGLPVPGVFLYKEDNHKMLIIDGFQRLETLKKFCSSDSEKKVFQLKGVSKEFNGKSYNTLPDEFKRKLDDTLLHATIIKADDPKDKNLNAIYSIFERLNTGGVNLSPQEIRNCVYHGLLQEKLISLAENETIKSVLNIDSTRKKDQEIILRLLALTYDHNEYTGNMKQFLNEFMDNKKNLTDNKLNKVLKEFEEVVTIMSKINLDAIIRANGTLSIAILDAIWVGMAKSVHAVNKMEIEDVISIVKELQIDKNFKEAIATGKTHHTDSVIKRINIAIKYFSDNKNEL